MLCVTVLCCSWCVCVCVHQQAQQPVFLHLCYYCCSNIHLKSVFLQMFTDVGRRGEKSQINTFDQRL